MNCLGFMQEAVLIFPHQLFKKHPAIQSGRPVFLVEESLFFNQYRFHLQKLVLHRASMKAYQNYLSKQKIHVEYIEASEKNADATNLIAYLKKKGVQKILIAEVADNWLFKKISSSCKAHGLPLEVFSTPNFYTSLQEGNAYFEGKKTYFQTSFYIHQRKTHHLLMEKPGMPMGGQWSFDKDNRERFPPNEKVPKMHFPKENKYVTEAKKYVASHFKKGYGTMEDFRYPVNFAEAESWLDDFLTERLIHFGKYEDAIVSKESFLYHSVLTPALNIGLLDPKQIMEKTMLVAARQKIPLNSLEGFTRQIIGWREFIRLVYEREGTKQRSTNYWGFTRKIPERFWTGKTGIFPIDNVIGKVLETGYCHHIERLMVLGNFMLLCEFDPDEVHRWFMELFIDAYDWVMVPNVYGMTQFADGGLMTTKPYISGSNYLMKMSDYPKGSWQPIWDGLFWRFMDVHRDFFLQNPRLGMLIKTFDKMSPEKQAQHHKIADQFLQQLDAK